MEDTIETHVVENGQNVIRRVSAMELLRRDRERREREKEENQRGRRTQSTHQASVGLLSTTLVHSPVFNQILPARIRGSAYNDLLFVGDDFVHIVNIQSEGRLRCVGTKSDFGSRIRAAAIVGKRLQDHDDLLSALKSEEMEERADAGRLKSLELPPQMLVVSLASGELLFVFAEYNGVTECLSFSESRVQLPLSRLPLLQPGRHLTVDPSSRTIAVGSTGGTIVLYKLKSQEQLEKEIVARSGGWNPVIEDLTVDAQGIILQMSFLTPRPDDEQHAILAAVVNDKDGSCRVKCYEIDVTAPLRDVPQLVNHPIDEDFRVVAHLIPTMYSPNFILVSGNRAIHWANVLTGFPTQAIVVSASERPVEDESYPNPQYPAVSSRLPMYTGWTRAERHHERWRGDQREVFFLVREDGGLHQISSWRSGFTFVLDRAGSFACTGSAAFTSFLASDKLTDPDYLVVAGQGSSGEVIRIGPIKQTGEPTQRVDVMTPQHIEWIPNWAPACDINATAAQSQSGGAGGLDSVYMTSGTQPFGAISELRLGLEACVGFSVALMEEHEMAAFTSIWPVLLTTAGGQETLLLLSAPDETLMVRYGSNGDIQAVDSDIESEEETLLAVQLESNLLLHATTRSLAVCSLHDAEDAPRLSKVAERSIDGVILTASYLEARSMVLIGVLRGDLYYLQLHMVLKLDSALRIGPYCDEVRIDTYPTAMQLFHDSGIFGALVADGSGMLQLFRIPESPEKADCIGKLAIPRTDQHGEFITLAESIAILSSVNYANGHLRAIIAVGLRDGSLWKLGYSTLHSRQTDNDDDGVQSSLFHDLKATFDQTSNATDLVTFGFEPVKILSQYRSDSDVAFLLCGHDVCRLKYQGGGLNDIAIDSIWFTDNTQPHLPPPQLHTMALHSLASRDTATVFGTAGAILLAADLDMRRRPLPRRMVLENPKWDSSTKPNPAGSPRIILRIQGHNVIAVATTVASLQRPASIPRRLWEGYRTVRGAIKFLRLDDPAACINEKAFELLPGERITAMEEWTDLKTGKDDTSAYLIIGTRYITKSANPKGRILILRVRLDTELEDELVPTLKIIKAHSFDDAPITAIKALTGSASSNAAERDVHWPGDRAMLEDEGAESLSGPSSGSNPRLAVALDKKLEKKLDIYELQMPTAASHEGYSMQDDSEGPRQLKLRRICSASLQSSAIRMTNPSPNIISVSTVDDSWQSYILDELHTLKLIKSDEIARRGADHLHLSFDGEGSDQFSMVLISDREGHVAGLQTAPPERSVEVACRTLFTANMPQAIVRLQSGNIRPLWRRSLGAGVRANNLVGVATDGSFYGFSILGRNALLLLRFLQNLVTYHNQGLRSRAGQYHGEPITIDPEFSRKKLPPGSAFNHVNGDTLLPFLEREGRQLLLEMLESPHWENDHTAAHVGNTVEDRTARFEELVRKQWSERTFADMGDGVLYVLDWLRGVLAPML